MKKCTASLFSKIVSFLIMLFLFVPMTGFSLYMFLLHQQAGSNERLMFLSGVVLFGGILIYGGYRMFYLGLVWLEYDETKVIFHYSRQEEHYFRWDELPGSRIGITLENGNYLFCIQGNGRQLKIPVNRMSSGYRDFKKMLESKGVLRRMGLMSQDEFKDIAKHLFEQFKNES